LSSLEASIGGLGKRIALQPGTVLPDNTVYYLIDGYCALISVKECGKTHSLLYFRPGMLMNFLPTVTPGLSLHPIILRYRNRNKSLRPFAITKTQCAMHAVDGKAFLRKLEVDIDFCKILINALAENFINLYSATISIGLYSAMARVARLLLDNAPEAAPYQVPSFLTYDEIANHLSLHKITVAKIFNDLRQRNILKKAGKKHEIIDLDSLGNLVQECE
jgi:CRP-like cAMP-binding protein